jgi:predicted nucleic acid-binding protein
VPPGWPDYERCRPASDDLTTMRLRIAVCDQVAMELLWSARDLADFRETEAAPLLACPWFAIEPSDWIEARRVFRELAARGPLHHRQVKIPAR